MVQGYTKIVRKLLLAHGRFVRAGKGDDEIWLCPGVKRPIVVDGRITSRVTAQAVLKQAGISAEI